MTAKPTEALSYNIDEGMLDKIGEEFSTTNVVSHFAEVVAGKAGNEMEKVAQEVFGKYGMELAKRSLELGEKHTDATYEAMKEAIAKTGYMYWPLVPQRFLEIAYLSVMPIQTLKVLQNNADKLAYRLVLGDCAIYDSLKEKTSAEVAKLLPCRHGCITLCETILRGLKIDGVKIEMEATMPKNGRCIFAASKV